MTKKILFVDDEPHVLRIMKMSVQREDFSVLTAKNGIEGLACIHEHHPDAIVVDIEMPKMNGRQMCEQLYKDIPDNQIPIFIATSRAEDEYRLWTHNYPLIRFMEKPISLRTLTHELNKALASPINQTEVEGTLIDTK
jgi:CheY-like chemotaxis protein